MCFWSFSNALFSICLTLSLLILYFILKSSSVLGSSFSLLESQEELPDDIFHVVQRALFQFQILLEYSPEAFFAQFRYLLLDERDAVPDGVENHAFFSSSSSSSLRGLVVVVVHIVHIVRFGVVSPVYSSKCKKRLLFCQGV